jgi:hypothetical protein
VAIKERIGNEDIKDGGATRKMHATKKIEVGQVTYGTEPCLSNKGILSGLWFLRDPGYYHFVDEGPRLLEYNTTPVRPSKAPGNTS